MHQIFHVLALLLFLPAIAVAFLGLIQPLLGDAGGVRLPALRTSLLLAAGAALGLGADSLVHHLLVDPP